MSLKKNGLFGIGWASDLPTLLLTLHWMVWMVHPNHLVKTIQWGEKR